MNGATTKTVACGYCGQSVSNEPVAPERFGERFCSVVHADEFVAGVRGERMQAAARAEGGSQGGCGVAAGPRTFGHSVKRAACWGAPLLLLLALPLIWSGSGWAVAGGFLSVLALLACPLGMFIMMRMMMGGQPGRAQDSPRAPASERVPPPSGSER